MNNKQNVRQLTVIEFPFAQPAHEAEMNQRLQALAVATRKKPGCLACRIYGHAPVFHRFVLYQRFADQAAFEANLRARHTAEFMAYIDTGGASLRYECWSVRGDQPLVAAMGSVI